MKTFPVLLVIAAGALAACTRPPPPEPAATTAPPADSAPPNTTPAPAPPPPAPPPAPAPGAVIPAAFQGTWAHDAAACSVPGHESRLVLGADTVRFHESIGPVTQATAEGGELTLVLRLTGEGQTREATYRFGLSGDGSTLTDRDNAMVRTRCR